MGPTLEKYVVEGATLINLFCPLSTSTLHPPGIVAILDREVSPKKNVPTTVLCQHRKTGYSK